VVCIGICTNEEMVILRAEFHQAAQLVWWRWSVVCNVAGGYQEALLLAF